MRTERCEAIPRPSEWYAQEPFDLSLNFSDVDGNKLRYMATPLDETYAAEPGDHYEVGSIPPEEREVRDHLLLAVVLRGQVSSWEFWWSQFFGETKAYKASRNQFKKLDELCHQSREHRAAFCRLSKDSGIVRGLRMELTRIVDRCDKDARHERIERRDGGDRKGY